MSTLDKKMILEKLTRELPPLFARAAVPKLLPGIYQYQTLCNFETEGIGPPSTKIGKKVCYERESFLQWFSERIA